MISLVDNEKEDEDDDNNKQMVLAARSIVGAYVDGEFGVRP